MTKKIRLAALMATLGVFNNGIPGVKIKDAPKTALDIHLIKGKEPTVKNKELYCPDCLRPGYLISIDYRMRGEELPSLIVDDEPPGTLIPVLMCGNCMGYIRK